MWNVKMIHAHPAAVFRGLEVTFYAILGALLIGQIFLGEGAVSTSEALLTLGGEMLLSLVATGSAPLGSLLAMAKQQEILERGHIVSFRPGRQARRSGEEERRHAA